MPAWQPQRIQVIPLDIGEATDSGWERLGWGGVGERGGGHTFNLFTHISGRGKRSRGCIALPSIWRPPMLKIIWASLKSNVYLTLGMGAKGHGVGGRRGWKDIYRYLKICIKLHCIPRSQTENLRACMAAAGNSCRPNPFRYRRGSGFEEHAAVEGALPMKSYQGY